MKCLLCMESSRIFARNHSAKWRFLLLTLLGDTGLWKESGAEDAVNCNVGLDGTHGRHLSEYCRLVVRMRCMLLRCYELRDMGYGVSAVDCRFTCLLEKFLWHGNAGRNIFSQYSFIV